MQQNTRCHTQQVESTNHLKRRQSNSIEGQFTQEKTNNQAESKKAKVNTSTPNAKGPKATDRNNNSKSLQQNCKTREIISHAPPHQPSGDENAKQEEQQRGQKLIMSKAK